MNDNDIIKALECCGNQMYSCTDKRCKAKTLGEALDLINRQKAEIERLKNKQKPTGASGYKIENGKVVFFTNMLSGYRYEYKDLDEVVKTLNELLQECYSKDEIAFALRCKTEELKTAKSEAIKEFAERAKENGTTAISCSSFERVIPIDKIDTLVKEMVGE